MYFSCSVDIKSSKFQISNTRGKVICHIPKRGDGAVGELVIQNPAPVPFHALPLWDSKLNDLRYRENTIIVLIILLKKKNSILIS